MITNRNTNTEASGNTETNTEAVGSDVISTVKSRAEVLKSKNKNSANELLLRMLALSEQSSEVLAVTTGVDVYA